MNRRTLLRRIGATGIAATTLGGTATARRSASGYGIDREIDVSAVSGRVTLAELLDPADLRRLNDGVDPRQREFIVHEETDAITLGECCVYCCDGTDYVCEDHCDCCECDYPPCY